MIIGFHFKGLIGSQSQAITAIYGCNGVYFKESSGQKIKENAFFFILIITPTLNMIFKIRSAYYQTKYQAALLKTFFYSSDNSIG